jgi:uncharacterized protein with ATP-grasp and redox domains
LKSKPECLPCLANQAYRVLNAASDDDWSQRKVLGEVFRWLHDVDLNQPPAELVAEAIQRARLNASDPFVEARTAVHQAFAPIVRDYVKQVQQSAEPMSMAIVGAAAANLADALILEPELDLQQGFQAGLEAGFATGDPAELIGLIKGAKSVLYLLDNAGEVLIDVTLIDMIRSHGASVRAVARAKGLLHDVTVQEAVPAGLVGVVEVEVPVNEAVSDEQIEALSDSKLEEPPDLFATSPGVLGVTSRPVSVMLQNVINAADLVISKGSSNYQTFSVNHCPVAHLLRPKCGPVARQFGVQPGDLVLDIVHPTAPPAEG